MTCSEDKAEASIVCQQTGPVSFTGELRQQEEVFNERLSILFKKLRVVRMVDSARNTLVRQSEFRCYGRDKECRL